MESEHEPVSDNDISPILPEQHIKETCFFLPWPTWPIIFILVIRCSQYCPGGEQNCIPIWAFLGLGYSISICQRLHNFLLSYTSSSPIHFTHLCFLTYLCWIFVCRLFYREEESLGGSSHLKAGQELNAGQQRGRWSIKRKCYSWNHRRGRSQKYRVAAVRCCGEALRGHWIYWAVQHWWLW